jgi:hypothetical protein
MKSDSDNTQLSSIPATSLVGYIMCGAQLSHGLLALLAVGRSGVLEATRRPR